MKGAGFSRGVFVCFLFKSQPALGGIFWYNYSKEGLMRLLALFLFAFLAYGQDVLVENLTFPPLARQARIGSEVIILVGREGVEVLSGHWLFVPTAISNLAVLAALGAIPDSVLVAQYYFIIEHPETLMTTEYVDRNFFSRIFLKLFRRPTGKIIQYKNCINPTEQQKKNTFSVIKGVLRVTVQHQAQCLVTEPSRLLAEK